MARISCNIHDTTEEILVRLMKRCGSLTEVIGRALVIYDIVQIEVDRGNTLAFLHPDGTLQHWKILPPTGNPPEDSGVKAKVLRLVRKKEDDS